MRSRRLWSTMLVTCWGLLLSSQAVSAEAPDLFPAFTAHIQRQVEVDKQVFVAAQVCTEWFYKEHQPPAPRPHAEPVAYTVPTDTEPPKDASSDCREQYPSGLDAARKAFSHAQSALSVSLTFYEFALVGDRNDDHRYSQMELRDMLESFGLPFDARLPPSAHLAALTGRFDSIQQSLSLDVLMSGMGVLYDRGYRLTSHDQTAMSRVTR